MKNISNNKFDYLYFNISYLYLRRGKMSATTHHIREKVRLPINNFVFSVQKNNNLGRKCSNISQGSNKTQGRVPWRKTKDSHSMKKTREPQARPNENHNPEKWRRPPRSAQDWNKPSIQFCKKCHQFLRNIWSTYKNVGHTDIEWKSSRAKKSTL